MDNIESVYEELFGSPKYMLFVDETYNDLRQQIISLPYCKLESDGLPFEGVNFSPHKDMSLRYSKTITYKTKREMSTDKYYQHNLVSQSDKLLTDVPKSEISLILLSLKDYLKNKVVRTKISSLISSLYPVPLSQMHIFYLYRPNCCRAYGYYNEVSREFIILKGSLVAKSVGNTYAIAPRGLLRKRFIRDYCTGLKDYYIVHTDIVCFNPTMAATFVLGRVGSIKRWIDKDGKMLSEVYSFK